MILNVLAKITPGCVKRRVPEKMRKRLRGKVAETLPSFIYLKKLMLNYQTNCLVNEDSKSFRDKIYKFLQLRDYKMEGFRDPNKQRDLSIQFHWGHNHDFGEFFLRGMSGDRHISLLATFIDEFKVLPPSLEGLRVLDIGCWTGGTSLLLCAMGAQVVAVEEVKKYIDCLNYLKHSFDIDRLEVRNLSLYECTTADFQESFDFVLFAGVLYHVTDQILALRITFDCLKDGGMCLSETAVIRSSNRMLSYEGPTIFKSGSKKELSRGGWNWFIPSPSGLCQMMADVGYTEIRIGKVIHNRVFAVGKRHSHVDMMRAGLSVRGIR